MPATWRQQPLVAITSVILAVVAILVLSAGRAAAAPRASGQPYVKYYIVTAQYRGKPEYLAEIASRFLGSAARGQEIFDLNEGRTQPDGSRLTDPAVLQSGWVLVLPWDAIGAGVRYGLLPSGAVASPPATRPTRSTALASEGPPTQGAWALVIMALVALILLLVLRFRSIVRPAVLSDGSETAVQPVDAAASEPPLLETAPDGPSGGPGLAAAGLTQVVAAPAADPVHAHSARLAEQATAGAFRRASDLPRRVRQSRRPGERSEPGNPAWADPEPSDESPAEG